MDFATGQLVTSFQGQHSGVGQLLFSPDGRSLFSGAGDSTIVQWDATGRLGKRPRYVNLRAAWDALAGDAKVAYSARWDFLDSPSQALALFRQHIRPVPVPKSPVFQKLVEALDSASFAERQKAAGAIKAMGPSAEPLLRVLAPTRRLKLPSFVLQSDLKILTLRTMQETRHCRSPVSRGQRKRLGC